MTDDIVEQIKAKVLIEDVVSEDGFPLPQHGRYRKCTTKGTGGLVVDTQRQTFYWNTQGTWGDVIQWTMNQHRMDFKGAVETLARRAGLPEPNWGHQDHAARLAARKTEEAFDVAQRVFIRWLWKNEEAIKYCRYRGWSDYEGEDENQEKKPGTIIKAMLGYSGEGSDAERVEMQKEFSAAGVDLDSPAAVAILGMKGANVGNWLKKHNIQAASDEWILNGYIPGMIGHKRLVYPHVKNGRICYLSGRGIAEKRHHNLPDCLVGARQPFYNQVYASSTNECVVVEGQADAISLGQWEISAVALAGVKAGEDLAEELKHHKTIYVGLDADEAGTKNAWKVCDQLGPQTRLIDWSGGVQKIFIDLENIPCPIKDANDLLKSLVHAEISTDEQVNSVQLLLGEAPMYAESIAIWAGEQKGAAGIEAAREAMQVISKLDQFTLSESRKKLAKALGKGEREFNLMLSTTKEIIKKDETGNFISTMGGLIGDYFVEYLYDRKTDKSSLAWRDPEGNVKSGEIVEIDGKKYIAEPPSEAIKNGLIIFPSQLGQFKPAGELMGYITAFLTSAYLFSKKSDIKVIAAYCLLTWAYDRFNAIPYLRAIGEPGAGKSELMNRVGLCCYRTIRSNGAGSTSSLFHLVNRYKGTVNLDEFDMKESTSSEEKVKFINLGAMANNPIARMTEVVLADGTKKLQEEMFQTYCPKLLVQQKENTDKAIASRCLTFNLKPRTQRELKNAKISNTITPEMESRALALRNLLIRWRIQTWEPYTEIDPEWLDDDLTSRMNQISGCLMAIARDDPKLQDEIREMLHALQKDQILSKSMTPPARVIDAFFKIYRYPDLHTAHVVKGENGREGILIGVITRIANEIMNEMNQKEDAEDEDDEKHPNRKREMTPQGVGRIIRETFHLEVAPRKKEGFYVYWDNECMLELARSYGVNPDEIGQVTDKGTAEKLDAAQGKLV